MTEQTRRGLLKFICRALTFGYATLMLIPGARFLIEPLLRKSSQNGHPRRVIRLDDLPVDVPKPFAIKGSRLDAWTLYPEQTLGRIFLVRRGDDSIEAFTAECPHVGCIIEFKTGDDQFFCPCHRGVFDAQGKVVPSDQLGWKNAPPRDMDMLVSGIEVDEVSGDEWVTVVFERFEQGLAEKLPKS